MRAVAPPATVVSRSVVARVAPPPAPPPFQQKLTVIKKTAGRRSPRTVAAEMSIKDRGSAQAITAVRPVVAEAGRVTLGGDPAAAGQPACAARRVVAPVRPRAAARWRRPSTRSRRRPSWRRVRPGPPAGRTCRRASRRRLRLPRRAVEGPRASSRTRPSSVRAAADSQSDGGAADVCAAPDSAPDRGSARAARRRADPARGPAIVRDERRRVTEAAADAGAPGQPLRSNPRTRSRRRNATAQPQRIRRAWTAPFGRPRSGPSRSH